MYVCARVYISVHLLAAVTYERAINTADICVWSGLTASGLAAVKKQFQFVDNKANALANMHANIHTYTHTQTHGERRERDIGRGR